MRFLQRFRAWRMWRRQPIRTTTLTKASGNFAPGTRVEIRFNDPGPHASICPPEHDEYARLNPSEPG